MSKITRYEVFAAVLIIFGVVFAAPLLWQVLVVNHSHNVERDKFYAEHCQNVKESAGVFSKAYGCEG